MFSRRGNRNVGNGGIRARVLPGPAGLRGFTTFYVEPAGSLNRRRRRRRVADALRPTTIYS